MVAAGICVVVYIARRRRRVARVLAAYDSEVTTRPWYNKVYVTDCSAEHGSMALAIRGLHLGDAANPPESIVALKRGDSPTSLVPDASVILKPHIRYSLLAFAWLDQGFPSNGRAALVGVAGGSLLHFWQQCVPGGADLQIDAVEESQIGDRTNPVPICNPLRAAL